MKIKFEIHILNEDHCKAVQVRLFQLGYRWLNSRTKIANLKAKIIFCWDDRDLTYNKEGNSSDAERKTLEDLYNIPYCELRGRVVKVGWLDESNDISDHAIDALKYALGASSDSRPKGIIQRSRHKNPFGLDFNWPSLAQITEDFTQQFKECEEEAKMAIKVGQWYQSKKHRGWMIRVISDKGDSNWEVEGWIGGKWRRIVTIMNLKDVEKISLYEVINKMTQINIEKED